MGTVTKMRFHIDGAYITDLVRQVWVEGDMVKALHIMESGFPEMPESTRLAVCMGKKKLVGIDQMRLEDDDVTEVCGIKILTMQEQLAAREKELAKRELQLRVREELAADQVEFIPSPWGILEVPECLLEYRHATTGSKYQLKDMDWDTFEEAYPDLVMEAREKAKARALERMQNDALRAAGIDPEKLKTVQEEMLTGTLGRSESPPVVDKELSSMNGWISPAGELYGCGFMGHIDLADRLEETEGDLEKKKWVKLQDSRDPKSIMPRTGTDFFTPEGKVTQAQYDTMYTWCKKHNREFPEFVEVE